MLLPNPRLRKLIAVTNGSWSLKLSSVLVGNHTNPASFVKPLERSSKIPRRLTTKVKGIGIQTLLKARRLLQSRTRHALKSLCWRMRLTPRLLCRVPPIHKPQRTTVLALQKVYQNRRMQQYHRTTNVRRQQRFSRRPKKCRYQRWHLRQRRLARNRRAML